uniref:IRF tryptophan pentad repeat domain-containing protein n=1 Tax=Prolemur simus TaxID=1328070 RepID=A0A8C8YM65_PROSS
MAGSLPLGCRRGPLLLRDWLVAQIESGRYPGLHWEDAGKTLFRIPWKHVAKQGYQAQQDAALFRAWAVHKGKHLEGTDREGPSTWKTRLRCALNKSADFREVRERRQLDISNPYKVYRIACAPPEEGGLPSSQQEPPGEVTEPACGTDQVGMSFQPLESVKNSRGEGQKDRPVPCPVGERGRMGQGGAANARPARPALGPAGCWLHVRVFYGAALVREATARSAEGCRLSPKAAAATAAAERLLGPPPRVAQVRFPEPPPGAHVLQRLMRHLERGVLLWVAPEGVFAKRLCQGRVYWRGPLAPHRAQPNKLEREQTCQLLDTRRFLEGKSATVGRLAERGRVIRLCFGEEYPGPPDQPEERLVMAHVSPSPLPAENQSLQFPPEGPSPTPSSLSCAPGPLYDPT